VRVKGVHTAWQAIPQRGTRVRALRRWDDEAVKVFLVAAYADTRTGNVAPQSKRHAYLPGSRTTACGFNLDAMRRFAEFRFSDQPSGVRCPLCARVVGGDH
jgi:hypothetical protein